MLIFGIIGHYILRLIDSDKYVPGNFYSLYYTLFSLGGIAVSDINVIYIFFLGIFWSYILKLFLHSVDDRLVPNVKCIIFGVLNIANVYFIDTAIESFFANSSQSSIILLFILGAFIYIMDLSVTLRKSI